MSPGDKRKEGEQNNQRHIEELRQSKCWTSWNWLLGLRGLKLFAEVTNLPSAVSCGHRFKKKC
jgi:hypothetical protein